MKEIYCKLEKKGAVAAALLFCAGTNCFSAGKPNVLFIIADDMRPELGCYGVDGIKTPRIDNLANKGTVFLNAYCNIPVSGASRASLLTGVYPRYPNRFTSFDSRADNNCARAIPISLWFKEHGYYVLSNGKVSHQLADHANTWSEYPWRLHPEGYGPDWAEYNKWELWQNTTSGNFINEKTKRGPFCESAAVPDTCYDDGMIARKTISDLRRLKDLNQPFFLACGFWRPHLPFNAPDRYWDLYDRDNIKPAENQYIPHNLPKQVTGSMEIKSYSRTPADLTEEDFRREAKHGYYACVSFIDAQIGLILDELENLGLAKNTIVVIVGDHGWHLGEHTFWGKHNLMNCATRAPLIVYTPKGKPGKASGIVEFVDIYPSLCELCGIQAPPKQLQGKSFVRMLKNPKVRIKQNALVQWEDGVNLITEDYSYTVFSKDGKAISEMLFDRRNDLSENNNIACEKTMEIVCKNMLLLLNRKKEKALKE